MRTLTANALAEITTKLGTEPVTIIEVQWAIDGAIFEYADASVEGISGQILEVSDLDNVVSISDSASSQELSITLDDTDGLIKTIMDETDIHKRDVWVYQWFKGLAITDKFLLFRGKINTPITWSEGARTISFSVISQLEDKEIGFSPEEGQFPFIPNDLIGQPWPMIFGTAVDVPCVQITKAITGTLLEGVGVVATGSSAAGFTPSLMGSHDGWVPPREPDISSINQQYMHVGRVASSSSDPVQRAAFLDKESAIQQQISDTFAAHGRATTESWENYAETVESAQDTGAGPSSVRILGGEDFPRGEITIGSGSNKYTGQFDGDSDTFTIHSRSNITLETEIIQEESYTPQQEEFKPNQEYFYQTKVPMGDGDGGMSSDTITTKGFLIYGRDAAYSRINPSAAKTNIAVKQSWNDAGSTVTYSFPVTYVASIIPGTVLSVKAFKNFDGLKKLIDVPDSLYEIETKTYGTIQAVQITFSSVLSAIPDQEWSDEVYVTFESSIGPNIVDILIYLIQTYTDLSYDVDTFTETSLDLLAFPANFAYLDRKNIVNVLQEIAFQARCGLYLSNGIFYLKYLAKEPVGVDTISEQDIKTQSIEVSISSTEKIVTKYTAEWQISGAQEKPNKIILRHNVKKYGIQEETYNFYIYNQPDIILKVATFWLIRKANSWKHIKFETFLNKLNLETFDPVTLSFQQSYVASTAVTALIQQANFNSADQTISMECWLPVKSGSLEVYDFAWPAQVSADYTFPTDAEIDLGLAGGDGIGAGAEGELPVGDTSTIGDGEVIFIGGPNIVFGPNADYGDRNPSDVGFIPKSLNIPTVAGTLTISSKPYINTQLAAVQEVEDPEITDLPKDVFQINLNKTQVISTSTEDQVEYLSDVLAISEGQAAICIRTSALFAETGSPDTHKVFDFKYDTEGEKWGAGTAFLQD